MAYELPYAKAVEKKTDAITGGCTVERKYIDDGCSLEISLNYSGFKAIMYYCQNESADYSFLENQNIDKCLITKFEFDYSDIIYSIYDVHNAVEDKKFDTYVFHCLYNERQVLEAIDIVVAFINRNYRTICEINNNTQLQQKLDKSFDDGLMLVSKKITRQMLRENPKKYYKKHCINMFVYRNVDNPFTYHMNKGNKGELQRFFARESKRSNLIMFEQRYLEYLLENDFNTPENDVVERIHKQEKASGFFKKAETITTVISAVLAIALNIGICVFCEKKIEQNFYLLQDVEMDFSLALLLIFLGFFALSYPIIHNIVMKYNDDYDKDELKDSKKGMIIISLIGIVVILLSGTFIYFDSQKTIGISSNSVYCCQHIGKAETLSYDEVNFYLIDGMYIDDVYSDTFNDKQIIIEKDGEYLYGDNMEYLDVPKEIINSLPYKETYKNLEEFETAHHQ